MTCTSTCRYSCKRTKNLIKKYVYIFFDQKKIDTYSYYHFLDSKIIFPPDTCVLLSDFHREKAWSEWLCSEGNEVSHIGVAIKNMLNRIAQASTVSLYHEALNTFQSSAIWRDSQEIKDWFSNTWLPNVQVSVWLAVILLNSFKGTDVLVQLYST